MIVQSADSFDAVAGEYAAIRPGYPDELFEHIAGIADLGRESAILEVGCGTGQATLGFAVRGYRVQCIEKGPQLAALARRALREYPNVRVEQCRFEDWHPPRLVCSPTLAAAPLRCPPRGRNSRSGRPVALMRYSLLFSAQAYHWIDPAIGVAKPLECIVPGALVALVWNVRRRESTPLRSAIDRAYERHAPELAAKARNEPGVGRNATIARFAGSPHYEAMARQTFPWRRSYSASEYVRLLGTFSDHLALDAATREALVAAIYRVVAEAGSISVAYDATCHAFRRR